MRHRLFVAALSTTVLSACASYHAAPLSAESALADYRARNVDEAAVSARAGVPLEDNVYDRRRLLAVALSSNPSVAEARAHALSAQAAARASRAGPSMTLNLTAEYARTGDQSPWLYGASSDIPFDIGGRRGARVSASDFAALSARYAYEETVWATRMALRRALTERFLTAREVSVGQELASIRSRQMAALELRLSAGEASRSEVERVRVEAAADARRLNDTEAHLVHARSAVAQALGVPLSVADGIALRWDGFDVFETVNVEQISNGRDAALAERADVLAAVASYDQADSDLRGEVARQYPEIHLGPGYTWERGLVKLPFTLGIVLPPLDFAHNGVRAAEAHRQEAGAHVEAIVAAAFGEIDGALAEAQASRDALARVRAADLAASRRAADQSNLEISNGAIDRVDWSAAQVSLKLTQLAEIDALRRAHEADALLENALRRPLEGPELQPLNLQSTGSDR